jgi:hypothetical protein
MGKPTAATGDRPVFSRKVAVQADPRADPTGKDGDRLRHRPDPPGSPAFATGKRADPTGAWTVPAGRRASAPGEYAFDSGKAVTWRL